MGAREPEGTMHRGGGVTTVSTGCFQSIPTACSIIQTNDRQTVFLQENEKMKRFYMRQLHTMLESLGSFDFSKPNEVILRRNLAKIYQQVGKYCSKNNIEMTCNSKQVIGESVERFPRADELSLPPPPPPPPPPPLPVCTRIKETPVQLYKKRKVSSTKESDIPNKNCQQRTPLQCINEELMNRIRNSKLANLKSTPCKRSPGGTPMRRQRRLSESDTSDLITVALRRKFKNVALQSPNENGSPNVRSPAAEF